MNKQTNNLDEKELLKRIEDLIDGKTSNQKFTSSFLGFCSRLFSVRPKTDADFQLSLKRELLKKHPAHFEKEVESRSDNKIQSSIITIKEFMTMKKTKRFALIGIPATLVIAFAVIFTLVINPAMQTARAMEIVASDPQVRSVIEDYNLDIQEVITKGNVAYIILNTVDNSTHIMTVDLDSDTVGEIVKENDKNSNKSESFEQKAAAIGMSVEEFKSYLQEQYEAKAESKDMSVEEFKGHLIEQKKAEAKNFEEKAEANGMTVEEYKTYLREQYEAKAESKGMSVEEFKKYLEDQKKESYENFKAEAEEKGMTEAEYKAYLESQKR